MMPDRPVKNPHRDSRIAEQLAHEAAVWIQREASNRSLITVTHASLAAHGKQATIYVSVFPIDEARSALTFLERSHASFAEHLRGHVRISPMPAFNFALDDGSSSKPHELSGGLGGIGHK